jgi:hypothetical protein
MSLRFVTATGVPHGFPNGGLLPRRHWRLERLDIEPPLSIRRLAKRSSRQNLKVWEFAWAGCTIWNDAVD